MGGKRTTLESFRWPLLDIFVSITLWSLFGVMLNFLPLLAALLVGVRAGRSPFTDVLSSGALLIATTAILPLPLVDLAIRVQRARRTRILIVSFGGLVCFVSLMIYCFAFANYISQVYNQSAIFKLLSPELVAWLSVGFFGMAAVLGGICAGFMAAVDEADSGERSGSGG